MKAAIIISTLLLLGFSSMAMAAPFFGYGWGGGIIGLIILILDIIAIIEVVNSSRPVEQKLLWVLIILLLPLLGLILYYVIGKK
ncbi:PLDc N-terminal domain-containing protein [Marinicella litoralis]|uniref:Phospholipase D-like protein n=1 Tax=Marinicella litoralis TaxID=644220 RepID=A0A4R6XLS6_9GAMM|nr:PLDc N-terminal domain-containing protein [Marinicella litoralis]TDR20592.1 phospholipase D-like protein [Marinicella litoralis]